MHACEPGGPRSLQFVSTNGGVHQCWNSITLIGGVHHWSTVTTLLVGVSEGCVLALNFPALPTQDHVRWACQWEHGSYKEVASRLHIASVRPGEMVTNHVHMRRNPYSSLSFDGLFGGLSDWG